MANKHLHHLTAAVPMALPLVAVVGSLLGAGWWCLAALAVVLAGAARAWRVLAAVLLCAALCGLQGELRARNGERLRALPESGNPVLVGTVTRVFANSFVVQPAGVSPAVYVCGRTEGQLGDVLRLRVVPEPEPEAPPVRGMFDRRAWWRGMGVGAVCRVVGEEKLGHPFSWAAVRGAGLSMRDKLAARLMPREREDDPRRQVLCALLLGAKDLADADTVELFRRGGCLHAFAVSGMHVAIIGSFFWGLFRLLRVRPTVTRVLLPVVVGVYILLTGCAVSALRAYLMGVTMWSAVLLRRRLSLANTWCAAACLILMVRPYELYDAGFLLSFAVYAAICIGLQLCLRHDTPWFGPDAYIPYRIMTRGEIRRKGTEAKVRGVVVVSLCAWLVAQPVTLCCFHTLTPWGFLTNIAVALPLLCAMYSGMALLVLAGVPYGGTLAAWAADGAAAVLLSVVSFFGSLPGAYVPATTPQPAEAVAVYALGYGKEAVVLGNPGLVIGAGNESQVRYTTAPALFHAGFSPAAVLQVRGGVAEKGVAVLQQQFPTMRVISAQAPASFSTPAGRFTIYPAPSSLPSSPAENSLPYILWEYEGKRTLFVGDAAADVAETLPPEVRGVDVLILGAHPLRPLEDAEDIAAFGAKEVQLLPSARRRQAALPPAEKEDEEHARCRTKGDL